MIETADQKQEGQVQEKERFARTDGFHEEEEHSKNMTITDKNLVPLPPNGGYGWVIVFACFCCNAIVEGSVGSFGVFLPHLSSSFESTKAKTTVAGSFLIGGFLTAGPLASGLVNCFGCRCVTIVGSTLTVVAFTLSTQCAHIDIFIFVYGFLGGLGLAMIYLPAMIMVGYYFEEKRSLASGIAYSGAGIGMVIMPPIVALLLGEFDWKNAMILFSAFPIQGIILGALMRPLMIHDKYMGTAKTCTHTADDNEATSYLLGGMESKAQCMEPGIYDRKPTDLKVVMDTTSSESGLNTTRTQSMFALRKGNDNQNEARGCGRQNNLESTQFPHSCLDLPLDSVARKRAISNYRRTSKRKGVFKESLFISCQEISNLPDGVFNQIDRQNLKDEILKPLARRDIFYTGSIKELPEFKCQPDIQAYVTSVTLVPRADLKKSVSPLCPCFSKSTIATLREMFQLHLFLNPYFFIICLSSVIIQLGYFVPIVFIPEYAMNNNISEARASLLISVMGIANVIGRAGGGALGSSSCVDGLHLNNISLYMAGLATLILTLFTNYTPLIIYSIIFGLSVGVFVPLTTVFLVRYLGLHNLNNAMGLLSFVKGIASTIGPPVAGLLLDSYGSFKPVFYFSGTMFLVAGCSFYLLKILEKRENEKKVEADEQDASTHII